MNLQNLVTSQELAQQLYDRGYRGETWFWWYREGGPRTSEMTWNVQMGRLDSDYEFHYGESIPAPTLNELLELLPKTVTLVGTGYRNGEYAVMYKCFDEKNKHHKFDIQNQLPQNACAKLAIALHDEGVISLKDYGQ